MVGWQNLNLIFLVFVPVYYRVIALILVNIVLSWHIKGREFVSVVRYPNEGQYSPISVR